MTTWRVAAAQISSGTDVTANLALCVSAVDAAADRGARLVVLPEAAMASFAIAPTQVAEPLDGPFASGLREAAARRGITVVAGMFEPAADGRCFNTLLVTGPGVEASYRKVHLFDAFASRESDTVAPGTAYETVLIDGVTVGLATCYDVRFADQFTELGRRGAQVVVLPASWADGPGKAEQWDVLTRARALDAQAWFVGCGQARPDGVEPVKAPLGIGCSVVADPLGAVHGRLDDRPGLLVRDIDLELVARVRDQIPVLRSGMP